MTTAYRAAATMFGVDMPPDDQFFARDRSVDEMSEAAGTWVRASCS